MKGSGTVLSSVSMTPTVEVAAKIGAVKSVKKRNPELPTFKQANRPSDC